MQCEDIGEIGERKRIGIRHSDEDRGRSGWRLGSFRRGEWVGEGSLKMSQRGKEWDD